MAGVTLDDMLSYDDLDITSIPAPGWGDGSIWVRRPGIEDGLDINDLVQELIEDGVLNTGDEVTTLTNIQVRRALSLWYEVIVRCACNEDGTPLFNNYEQGRMILKRKSMDTITAVGQAAFAFIYEVDEQDPNEEAVDLENGVMPSTVSPPPVAIVP